MACGTTNARFGQQLREAGLMGSMGKVACAYDNSVMELFFGSMQIELLDRPTCTTRAELANAIFEWIEGWYNPARRHSTLDYLSPNDYKRFTPPGKRHDHHTNKSGKPGTRQNCVRRDSGAVLLHAYRYGWFTPLPAVDSSAPATASNWPPRPRPTSRSTLPQI